MSARTASNTQDKPTKPRPTDGSGRELDQWGLPFSGPARARRLAELGKPDPNVDPAAWVPAAPRETGKPTDGKDQSNGAPGGKPSAGVGAGQSAPVAPVVVTEKKNG